MKKIAINSDVEQMLSRQNFNGSATFTYKIEGGPFGWLGGGSLIKRESTYYGRQSRLTGQIFTQNKWLSTQWAVPEFDGAFNAGIELTAVGHC